MKYLVNVERSNNSITKQPDIVNNIDSILTLVTEKINAVTERKLNEKKLNIIIFMFLKVVTVQQFIQLKMLKKTST